MPKFRVDDYVELTCVRFHEALAARIPFTGAARTYLSGTAGFVEHVFCHSLGDEIEAEAIRLSLEDDEEFDDYDTEYSVRLADGSLLTVTQCDLRRAVHPMARLQLAFTFKGITPWRLPSAS